eukprot:3770627-Karenia_brevis.AAC.1
MPRLTPALRLHHLAAPTVVRDASINIVVLNQRSRTEAMSLFLQNKRTFTKDEFRVAMEAACGTGPPP